VREITFTWYHNAFDIAGNPITKSWDEWKKVFSVHQVRGSIKDTDKKAALDKAKNGAAIVLGEIPQGKTRNGTNLKSIHALSLDIEDRTDDAIEIVFDCLKKFEFFLWTTHKHGSKIAKGKSRLRIVLPLKEPIPTSEHPGAWEGLDRLVGHVNDPSTKDLARLNFLPSTFYRKYAWTFHNSGQWIDLSDLQAPSNEPEQIDELLQKERLTKIRHVLRSVSREDELKEPAQKLLQGVPFAEEGSRHKTVVGITMRIASKDKRLNAASLKQLFEPSLNAMQYESKSAPSFKEVFTAYNGAVKKLFELERLQGEEARKDSLARAKAYQEEAATNTTGKSPYTKDELRKIAESNKWTLDELRDRWIIQCDGGGWFMTETGEYAGPYSKDDMNLAMSKYLARAPVRLLDATKSGFRYRPITEVARECGSLADKIISDLTISNTYYNAKTRVMHEAIRPLRDDIKPKFDPEIDEWLKVAGGNLYEKIVDWMSCCSDLTKLLCAIYFDGAPSSGKTLFAVGMAKLWTDGPPGDIENALSDFNEELTRCPLVLADEEIPHRYHQTVTTTLRSMLSTTSRTLKRKYKSTSEVRGAVRLILTANNEFLLDSRDVASSQDLEAIAQRFLYVKVPKAAADLLNSHSRKTKEAWGEYGIAAHALWLAENHQIQNPGKRFWVEGDVSQMHRLLMTGSRWNSLVCEWLVKYLMNPELFDTKATGLIRIRDNSLLVNDQALAEGWDLYLKTKSECETAKVGAALRALSKSSRRQLRWQGRQIRYRVVDVDHLLSWSNRYNIGDKETILNRLAFDEKNPGNLLKLPKPETPPKDVGMDDEGNIQY